MTGRGPRSSGVIRHRGCKSRAVLTVPVGDLSVAEPGYHRTYGEEYEARDGRLCIYRETSAVRDSVGGSCVNWIGSNIRSGGIDRSMQRWRFLILVRRQSTQG